MKSNILDALESRLSVNSYLWPKNTDPYEFIEAILKAGIKNIGLHTDFIEEYGVNKLKQELSLNKINVTSINSVGYFTDNFYFKQHEKIFNYAKILKPDVVCVISGGILGGPNPISSEYNFQNKNLNIEKIRKESLDQLLYLFNKAQEQNLTLGLEPIGSWEILKKGHFNSISSCLNLVKKYEHKLIIERDGEQHYKEHRLFKKVPFEENIKNDKFKTKLVKEVGLKIARIPYWLTQEEEEIEIENILDGKPTYPDIPDLKQAKTRPKPKKNF